MKLDFFKDIYKTYKKNIKKQNRNYNYQIIRDSIDLMVKDLIKNTINNLKINKIKYIEDIYKTKILMFDFSDKY